MCTHTNRCRCTCVEVKGQPQVPILRCISPFIWDRLFHWPTGQTSGPEASIRRIWGSRVRSSWGERSSQPKLDPILCGLAIDPGLHAWWVHWLPERPECSLGCPWVSDFYSKQEPRGEKPSAVFSPVFVLECQSYLGSLISDGLGLSVDNRDIFGWDFTFHSIGSVWDGDSLSLYQGRLWTVKTQSWLNLPAGHGELNLWHWSDQSVNWNQSKAGVTLQRHSSQEAPAGCHTSRRAFKAASL